METFDHDLANYQNKYLSDTDDLCACGNEIDHDSDSDYCTSCSRAEQDTYWLLIYNCERPIEFKKLLHLCRMFYKYETRNTDKQMFKELREAYTQHINNLKIQ